MGSQGSKPTDSELEILAVLWRRGPSTVRQVHEHLGRDAGYTTALKLLQIMTDKGLVLRERAGKSHVYRPSRPEPATQKTIVSELLDTAFGGSTRKLLAAALSAKKASPRELDEIRAMIDEAARGQRGTPREGRTS